MDGDKNYRIPRKFGFGLDDLISSGMSESRKRDFEIFKRAEMIANDDNLGKDKDLFAYIDGSSPTFSGSATCDDFDIKYVQYREGILSKHSTIEHPRDGVDIFNDKETVWPSRLDIYYKEKPIFRAEKCDLFHGPGISRKEVYFKVEYDGMDPGLRANLLEKLTEGSRIANYLFWGK